MNDVPQDPRQAQQLANEIGTELQQKFGAADMQVIYDVENPYKNVIGFLLPLPSLADYIIKHVLKGEGGGQMVPKEPAKGEEEAPEQLPAQETPPTPEDQVKEIMMNRAGLK